MDVQRQRMVSNYGCSRYALQDGDVIGGAIPATSARTSAEAWWPEHERRIFAPPPGGKLLSFFAAVITLTMLYMHPVLLIISLAAAAGYVRILKGARHFGKNAIYLVPFLLFHVGAQCAFNHAGVTPLFIFQTATP